MTHGTDVSLTDMNTSSLYSTLIERDLEAVPAAVRAFRTTASSDELFLAVARFAVLAYAPSQHAKHAVLACLSAHELRDELGDRFDDLLAECARYAAASRVPWSEPPMTDPPQVVADQRGDRDELLAATRAGDRLRAERWLAKRWNDDDLASDYLTVAADDLGDLSHKLIIGTAAWKLAPLLGAHGRFATLRLGTWECSAYHATQRHDQSENGLPHETLLGRLIDVVVRERGSIVDTHAIFLLDAALEAADIAGDPAIASRVCAYLTSTLSPMEPSEPVLLEPAPATAPVYRLGRDYGQCLQAYAVARRLRARFPAVDASRFIDATYANLQRGPSFEEWSFA
jgi:hypothetical protein